MPSSVCREKKYIYSTVKTREGQEGKQKERGGRKGGREGAREGGSEGEELTREVPIRLPPSES